MEDNHSQDTIVQYIQEKVYYKWKSLVITFLWIPEREYQHVKREANKAANEKPEVDLEDITVPPTYTDLKHIPSKFKALC